MPGAFARMRASTCASLLAVIVALASLPVAALNDGHSLEAVREALQSPIPQFALDQAQRTDDQIMQTGMAGGQKFSLVTDARLQHAQTVVQRLLVAIGENPRSWVVRVLDPGNNIPQAFVYGGKYIYIYKGLIEHVQSDDELAVVVGHEIGHSVLKHNIRKTQDITSTLADLAAVYGKVKGNARGANAMALAQQLHNGYSRDDEREADAFGVLAAWRAKFDPLRGADFFTRLEQAALTDPTYAPTTVGTGDHPADQERIAAIAAEVDWLHGARSLRSMQAYPRAFTVIVALVQDQSPIFAGLRTRSSTSATSTDVGASTTTAAPIAAPVSQAHDTANQEAAEASARAIEAERERIDKARAEERQAAAKQNLAKCKPDDDQCRRMAWQ